MNEKIEVEILYTADDFARATHYLQTRGVFMKYLFLAPLIVILAIALFLFVKDPSKFTSRNFLVFFTAAVLVTPVLYFLLRKPNLLLRKQLQKQVSSSPSLQEPQIVTLDDEGISGQQKFSSGTTR